MFDGLSDLLRGLQALQLTDLQSADWKPFFAVIVISFVASVAISLMYSVFFERRSTGSDVHRAFPLLGASITAIFICLQFSLPLSLGLLGALSIVRFRMPIKEPEEIGFLMLLIATSICCATLNFLFLGLLLSMTVAALVGMRLAPWLFGRRTSLGSLVITASPGELDRVLADVTRRITAVTKGAKLDAITSYEGRASATFTFYRGSGDALTRLQSELRDLVGGGEVSLFFLKPLAL